MAASQEQKVDFLLKKIGYVQSKTGIAEDASGISGTKKAPTEENKPSPLVVPSTSVWADSTFIPTSPPTSNTTYVGIYTATNAFQLTHDNTVTGNRTFIARSTFGNQTASISGDWIDPSFGADYAVQVYKGDPNSGGVSLSPTGSGNSDEWFFDYSSGILNFNGTNVPSGITTSNVYLIGYKYLGAKGVLPPAGRGDFTSFIVSGLSTFTGNIDANADLDVDGRTELDITNISETLNVVGIATFANNIDANGDLDVDGRTELDITNISETLNVVGISTFASDIDINASIDVDGHTELDDVNVSTALTANNLVVTGSTLLKHSDSLKLQTTGIGVSVSNGVGLTATIAGPSNLIIDPGIVGDNTGIVRIKGDLFVDGAQTQINSTTIELADFIVGVATTATSDLLSDGAGIQIGPNNTFLYEFNSGTNPSLKSSENLNVASGKVYQIDQTERLSADTLSLGTGTTIHSPASNTLTFGTNSTEKVRITSDGDVGIGSVIPAGKLDVVGHTELDNLNVSGVSTFASDLDINASVDIDGHTELDNLNVSGVSTFASNVDLNADLDVDGRTELDITNISETLNVTGVSTFASNIDANGDLDVDGHTELDHVNVSAASTFGGLIDINAGAQANTFKVEDLTDNRVVIAGSGGELEDDANLTFDGSTFAVGVDLDVDGRTELDITNISETLNVTGIATFASNVDLNADLDVDGHTELDDVNISGVTTIGGLVDINAGAQANTFKVEDLTDNRVVIAGTGGELEDDANLTFNGSTLSVGVDLDVDGHTELDNVNISGVTTVAGNIDANGDLDVDGHTNLDNLSVSGVTTFTGAIDANGDLDVDGHTELDDVNVSGASTFAGNIDANGDLDVDGRTELDITNISETLNVTGITTFENNVNVGGALSVTGNSYFVGMVTFAAGTDGNIVLGNTATDNVVFNADIDSSFIPDDTQTYDLGSSSQEWRDVYSQNVKVSSLTQNRVVYSGSAGQLQTSGNLEFIDGSQLTVGVSLTVTGGLDVDGHTEIDDVNVSGASTFAGNIDANGDLDVDGRTELDITNISETLNVVGISTFTGNADFNGSVDVDGHTELDDLNVSGVSTFAGGITASGSLNLSGNLDVDGRTELDITNISETLNVTGISTFASNLDINASVDIDGHTELDNLNVSGVSTFVSNVNLSANLDVDGQTDLDILNVAETATFASNIDANGNLDVDGQTDLDVLNVAETATFASNIDANGNLDVDGTTELDVLNVAENATFSSNIDANGDLDVDGHTELDNLNVSGVSTFVGNTRYQGNISLDDDSILQIGDDNDLAIYETNGDVAINYQSSGLLFIRSNNNFQIDKNGSKRLYAHSGGAIDLYYADSKKLETTNIGVDITGHTETDTLRVSGISTFTGNIDANGNVDIAGTLDVDGHTELDDVNISGVATATAFHTGAEGSAIRVTSSTISGPAEIVIDPAAVGDNTGALRIKGDLFVDGTQTVINSTSIELADFIVGIATTATSDALADGAGIQIGPNNTLLYDHTNTSLKSSENLNLTTGKTYKINGTDVLSATTLGSNVVNSSLTSLGTIATGVWQGTAINDTYIDTIDNANKVSLSALNIDGGTDIGALLADGDLIIVDDGAGGTNRKADVLGITTYTFSKVSGDVLINSSGAATIQANSVALETDTTGDFVQSISGTANEITVSVTSGENVQPQIGLPDDVTVSNSLKVGTGITAQGGIITATTFVGNGDFVDIDVDGHTELDNVNVAGVSTFAGEIDANGRIVGAATSNVIPFLYSNFSDLPSASTYHGAFAHVHATGKGYYAHANNWVELVNKETSGVTGTGVENYNVGVVTATTFDGDINLDNNNITGSGSVNITGIITTTNTLHVGAGGTVISASAETGTFAIGSATTSITATMNGGAIPSIGLVIALGG